MNTIVLSIHSRHAENILNGKKKWEFRKSVPKNRPKNILLYATKPIGKIVGVAEVHSIYTADIESMWRQTQDEAGITRKEFLQYFKGKNKGYMIKISRAWKFQPYHPLSAFNIENPPQSWRYLDNNLILTRNPKLLPGEKRLRKIKTVEAVL